MMAEWMLVILLNNNTGTFLEKSYVPFESQKACERVLSKLHYINTDNFIYQGECTPRHQSLAKN
jgi:hypothetical protein